MKHVYAVLVEVGTRMKPIAVCLDAGAAEALRHEIDAEVEFPGYTEVEAVPLIDRYGGHCTPAEYAADFGPIGR